MSVSLTKQASRRFWLKTPTLRFERVEADQSLVLPLVVEGAIDQLLHLEVVVPPFAPFSVTQSPASFGRRDNDPSGACLWVRYDPRSGTSFDEGQMTICVRERNAGPERTWTVSLFGCGHLVREI